MRHKTRIHTEMDNTIKTMRAVLQKMSDMIDQDMTLTESWIPIEDFDSDYIGLCWALYDGDVLEVRRVMRCNQNYSNLLYVYRSLGANQDDDDLNINKITRIIPIPEPAPPNGA